MLETESNKKIDNNETNQISKSSLKKNKSNIVKATPDLKIKEKKKTTINDEIIFCVENNIEITITLLSKRTGVSTHRVRKYCKSNFINLEKINKNNYKNMLSPKRIKELKKKEKEDALALKVKTEEKKLEAKLKSSLKKSNIKSSKHKMPIITNSDSEKISIVLKTDKLKLF